MEEEIDKLVIEAMKIHLTTGSIMPQFMDKNCSDDNVKSFIMNVKKQKGFLAEDTIAIINCFEYIIKKAKQQGMEEVINLLEDYISFEEIETLRQQLKTQK